MMEKYGTTNPSQVPEFAKKMGEKNSIHQKGNGNSQYGTMWITNGTENKKMKKVDPVPDGWYKGRRIKQVNK